MNYYYLIPIANKEIYLKMKKMNKEKYEKGYIQAYIDYDRLINNGYTKDDALFELDYLCPYFPQFEDKKRQKYVVIKTSYGKGYQQGLNDIDNGTYEKEKLIARYENSEE